VRRGRGFGPRARHVVGQPTRRVAAAHLTGFESGSGQARVRARRPGSSTLGSHQRSAMVALGEERRMKQILRRSKGKVRCVAAASALVFLSTLGVATTARAGACQSCQTSADCKSVSADAVCVDWMGNLSSCTSQVNCCPGQGCGITNGVPSCVTSGECRVVGGGAGGAGGTSPASTSGDDGGCSCRLPVARSSGEPGLLALLVGMLVVLARRRSGPLGS
jgi:hypothetical protein